MDFATTEIRKAWLMSASPEAVYAWLKQNAEAQKINPSFDRGIDPKWKALFSDLISRKERLIDLGTAQYCFNYEIARKLWTSGDKAVRHAIASNEFLNLPSVFSRNDSLFELLSGDDAELQKICIQHPRLDKILLASIIDRPKRFEDEEQWARFAVYAIQRPDLQKDAPSREDDPDAYKDELPFISIYRLLINITPSIKIAELLCNEVSSIGRWVIPPEEFQDASDPEPNDKRVWRAWKEGRELLALKKMLEKWDFNLADSDKDNETTARWTDATYQTMREGIASLVPVSKLKLREYIRNHSDQLIRSGYYMSQNYNSPEDFLPDFQKDRLSFLFAAVQNKSFYLRSKPAISEHLDRLIDAADWEKRPALRYKRQQMAAKFYQKDSRLYSLLSNNESASI